MKRSLFSIRSGAFLVFGVFLLLLLLTHAQLAMDGVRRGLAICAETLFPSLFPFLVLSELLVAMQAGPILGKLLARPVRAVFGLSGSAAASLLLGAVCGFPTAMSSGMAFYRRGELTREELGRLLLFANNPSSGFLISAVGRALFGSQRAGLALFLITLLSSALIGVLLHLLFGAVEGACQNIPLYIPQKELSASVLTGCVQRGFSTLLQVAAFLLFFSAVTSCLCAIPALCALPTPLLALLTGGMEMTGGIGLAASTLSPQTAFLVTAFLAGFAGLSVCLQLFSVCEGAGLRLIPYLLAKLTQGLLSAGLAWLYLKIREPELTLSRGALATDAGLPVTGSLTWLPCGVLAALLLLAACLFRVRAGDAAKSKRTPRVK